MFKWVQLIYYSCAHNNVFEVINVDLFTFRFYDIIDSKYTW